MEIEQLAIKLQEVADRSLRNESRIRKLEGEHEALHKLTTSVAVMAEQLKAMHESMDTLTSKLDKLEKKPGQRWEAMADKVIWAVLAAVIAFMLGRLGL